MKSYKALFLVCFTISSVTAQTFQYSRGWTNGKRGTRGDVTNWTNGMRGRHDAVIAWANSKHDANNDIRELTNDLEKVFNPCQINKLKILLEGKALSDTLFLPCDISEDEAAPKRPRNDLHHTSDLFDTYQ